MTSRKSKQRSRLTATDRQKFLGAWEGPYACAGGEPVDDRLVIERGPGALDVIVIIHAGFLNPDRVRGRLVSAGAIDIPEQSMGNAPGTARITLSSPKGPLSFVQRGMGLECRGDEYKKTLP